MTPHDAQHFVAGFTPWHITFGTYGTRLHGDERPTVDKQHNAIGKAFVDRNRKRRQCEQARMNFPPRYLTIDQRLLAEVEMPSICRRGGWRYRVCAAAPDHVHVLCDVVKDVHGEKVRRLIKRWLGQALSEKWGLPEGATWWAEEGSNIAVKDVAYLKNVFRYVWRQRVTPIAAGGRGRPGSLISLLFFAIAHLRSMWRLAIC